MSAGSAALRTSSSGQASIAVLLAALLGAAVLVVVGAGAAAALERARAQRVADAAALEGALRLGLDPLAPAAALEATRRAARSAGVEVLELRLDGDVVELRVRRGGLPIRLPAVLGGGVVPLRVQAVARAAPGLPALPALPPLDVGSGPGAVPDWVPAVHRPALLAAAVRERLPAALLAAQLWAESGFRVNAVSPVGALGIAQFMPATWAGAWNPWRVSSPFDPVAAIAAQGRYLAILLRGAQGRVARALAAYNAGAAAVDGPEPTWPAETRAYVRRVLARAGQTSVGGLPVAMPPGFEPDGGMPGGVTSGTAAIVG